ncbi:MAG: hypothetical protein V4731_10855 [Pseudomonadota bacterium]
MSWLKSALRSSFVGLLGPSASRENIDDRTEDIREAMVDAMGAFGEAHFPKIVLRVRYAQDVQGLWYARSDVMAVLSAMQGETIARKKLTEINEMFAGLLPSGLHSRPTPLSS